MGQKQFVNFNFPLQCIGTNISNFSNKKLLKLPTSGQNLVKNANIHFQQMPAYQHQTEVKTLTFVTYNIWFEMQNQTNRIPCIFKLLQRSNADFICLQEVTKSFVAQLQKQNWVQKYNISGYPMRGYDTLILSKFGCKFKHVKYNKTGMGRSLVIGQVKLNQKVFAIATSHFESLNNTDIRIEQLNTAFKNLDQYQDGILMGDFNFDSQNGHEQKAIPKQWKDLYLQIHKKCDYTMPRTDRYPSWRPDRMLLKSKNYTPEWIQRIGNFTIPPFESQNLEMIEKDGNVRTPSDHFGLASIIKYSPK